MLDPDRVLRQAKAKAAERWIGLKRLHKETKRINRIIEEEFEKIEPEDLI